MPSTSAMRRSAAASRPAADSTRALNPTTAVLKPWMVSSICEIKAVCSRCTFSIAGSATKPRPCSAPHPSQPTTAPKFTPTITIIAIRNARAAGWRLGPEAPSASADAGPASNVEASFASDHALSV